MSASISRRQLLSRGAALAASTTVAGRALPAFARKPVVPLPSPGQVRDEFTRMVEFGPRLTASTEHGAYVSWLEDEFERAGLTLTAPDSYTTDRWLMQSFSLEVLEGAGKGPVDVATYYPRSQETPAAGISGPLVYGGVAPALAVNGADIGSLQAGVDRHARA